MARAGQVELCHTPAAARVTRCMKLPNTTHTSRPWRIHELTRDFRLEDVWALPTPGGPNDLPRLVRQMTSGSPSDSPSRIARTLWAIRWKVGELLGWDDPDSGHGADRPTLRDRLPADLRDAPSGPEFDQAPFTSVYLLEDEWASEIVNRTVHGVMHIGWVPDGTGGYRGEMAVLVKPNGRLGAVYMAAIRPFRHVIVYPPLLREIERDWQAGGGEPGALRSGECRSRPQPTSPPSAASGVSSPRRSPRRAAGSSPA